MTVDGQQRVETTPWTPLSQDFKVVTIVQTKRDANRTLFGHRFDKTIWKGVAKRWLC